ncbi:methionine--tRNA ligase [Erysipelothrix rhusiopathiae]|uniref:Methionine--tRNA ligase n=1 Tax=Erysipelothrix rhusiopathiae ATCC 19414 TaxID=525280 RepID=E7FWE9_ERYRH|nr:methionine--tRNA ligase [Erysipelothrix rhusiopathiae]EFY08582.1 methionine--tRNA ligase [Erysipelothrix rhusiopathiae ATCC 19414]MDE8193058.1 methionine--tRNA ligase [Erysipelothrix rhusiopathiae]MDV7680098.1 methionine--tRNA ligase [Erysipelothrix rhusiopathiae]VEH83083.1 Methionine--tRNA ligase [Erysipelothrix rhusiopathiae]
MKNNKNYYITTAIAYTSAKPHIGNIYEIVLADSIARFKRAQGYNVRFQTGTDEHGQKIEDNAKEHNMLPKDYVDNISGVIRGLFDLMNVKYDYFIRTTDDYHKEQVQKVFKKLFDQGDLYKGNYEGWYCKSCESFYSDSQVEDETCPECGGKVVRQQESCYFFKMSNYQERLVQYIKDNPSFIQPESRKNEMLQNFLKEDLYDLAVSRTSFKWGIPVDFDPEHVVYVWIDALINYITGLGYDVDGNNGPLFDEFWPADVHLIGKDILRFHTIYWPILLMALDIELPKQIFGHPWLLTGDSKMSKSKGNAVYVDDLTSVLGVDPVRYIMLHEMPFERDGHLTYELMIERINTDLANIIGNLVNRTISMTNKYFDGVLTVNHVDDDMDDELIAACKNLIPNVEAKMDTLHVADAISEIVALFRKGNKYIDDTQPWVLAKDETKQERLQTVLYNLTELIRIGGIALESFIPETSQRILAQLQTEHTSFESAKTFGLFELNKPVVSKTDIIFNRLDVKETLELLEKEVEPVVETSVVEEEEVKEITFDQFQDVELRTGTIVKVDKHPKADKLYVLQVDLGSKEVTVVSSLVDFFTEEELLNHKVVLVANLKPVKLRGVMSNGMILTAEEGDKVRLVTGGDVANGTLLR